MNAIMIDLETLSLRPEAHVLQVGVCVADLGNRRISQPFDFWLTEDQPGRHTDRDTVSWWAKQDPAVQARVMRPPEGVARKSVDELHKYFVGLVHSLEASGPVTVWAKPGMFDLPILTSLFEGRKPWRYYTERCLQTYAAEFDPGKALRPQDNPMAHVASADAAWQAQYLLNIHVARAELGR